MTMLLLLLLALLACVISQQFDLEEIVTQIRVARQLLTRHDAAHAADHLARPQLAALAAAAAAAAAVALALALAVAAVCDARDEQTLELPQQQG